MPDETDNKSDIKSDKNTNSKTTKKSSTPVSSPDHISNAKSEPEKINDNKSKSRNEAFELPVIPDYDRPDLEQYEPSEFNPSDFSKRQEIPAKGVFKVNSDKENLMKSQDNNITPASEKKSILKNETPPSKDNSKKKSEKIVEDNISKSVDVSRPELKKLPDDDKSQSKIEKNDNVISLPKWKKYQDIAEIDDFFTPELEVYEKTDYNRKDKDSDLATNVDFTKEKESVPIEILITEPEEPIKKSVSFDPTTKDPSDDSQKKKKPRRVYDPLAWISDEENADETQAQIETDILTPLPDLPKKSKPKYDPFAYIPDKDDVPSEIITNEDQVIKKWQFA